MPAKLSRPTKYKVVWHRRCSKCRAEVDDNGWMLSWAYGNGRMIYLFYCSIEHLPKKRQDEARRFGSF